jgi:hypothetical protein
MTCIEDLDALIQKNGTARDQERLEVDIHQEARFGADLIYREAGGFELWLGSLEDALNLRALRQNKINAILNCALEESRSEVACRQSGGVGGRRSRSHARGPSAMQSSDCSSGELDRDKIWELASFDPDWYSLMVGEDVAYCGFAARDEPGYDMVEHVPEALAFLQKCREEGRRVVVHCIAGINRSSMALVSFLCANLHMKLEDAVDLTSKGRGFILSNMSFLEQLSRSYGEATI